MQMADARRSSGSSNLMHHLKDSSFFLPQQHHTVRLAKKWTNKPLCRSLRYLQADPDQIRLTRFLSVAPYICVTLALGGCPRIGIFVRIKDRSKKKRRHIIDIGVYAYLRVLFFEYDAESGTNNIFGQAPSKVASSSRAAFTIYPLQ